MPAMQGKEKDQFVLFGHTPFEQVVPQDHPVGAIRHLFDKALKEMAPVFEEFCSASGKLTIRFTAESAFGWLKEEANVQGQG